MAGETITDKLVLDVDQPLAGVKKLGETTEKALGVSAPAAAKKLGQALTEDEKRAKSLLVQITKLNKKADFAEAKKASAEYQAALKRVENATRRVTEESKVADGRTSAFSGAIGKVGAAAIAYVAVDKLTDAVVAFGAAAKRGSEIEDLRSSFEALGGTANRLRDLRDAVNGTISDAALQQMHNMAVALKINGDSVADLMEIAKTASKATGQSMEFMAQSIVTGVARRSAPILDNLGISAKALRDSLEQLGTTASEASNEQFMMAVKMASGGLKNVAALRSQSDAYGQLQADIQNGKDQFALFANEVLRSSGVLDTMREVGEVLGKWFSENKTVIKDFAAGAIADLADKFKVLVTMIDGTIEAYAALDRASKAVFDESLWDSVGSVTQWFDPLTYATIGWNNALESGKWALDAVGATAESTGRRVDFFGDKVSELTGNFKAASQAAREKEEAIRSAADADEAAAFKAALLSRETAAMTAQIDAWTARQDLLTKLAATGEKLDRQDEQRRAKAAAAKKQEAAANKSLAASMGAGGETGGDLAGGEWASQRAKRQRDAWEQMKRSGSALGSNVLDITGRIAENAAAAHQKTLDDMTAANESFAQATRETLVGGFSEAFTAIVIEGKSARETLFSVLGSMLAKLATAFSAWAVTEIALFSGNPWAALGLSAAMGVAAAAISAMGSTSTSQASGGGAPNVEPIVRAITRDKNKGVESTRAEVNIYGLPSGMFDIVEGEARRRGYPKRAVA